jgi:methanogenic corrinoid protein MtbC1
MSASVETGAPQAFEGSADLLHRFERALLSLDGAEAGRLVQSALAQGPAVSVIESLLVPSLERLGQAWEAGAAALSQVYMAGRLCEDLVNRMLPSTEDARPDSSRVAIVTLEDYHLLGKRIVLSALRASGAAVRDYGQGRAEEVARRAAEDRLEVLLVSTLMLPSALRVRELRRQLELRGCSAKVVVGGAPFRLDPQLAAEVGADASGNNAADAIRIVRALAGGRP